MKVLNLRCSVGHDFEGWFASEDDFQAQPRQQLIECPVCGNTRVEKMLSAPHLNLGHGSSAPSTSMPEAADAVASPDQHRQQVMQAMYERMVQHVIEHTTDVGEEFADQARKMHHGEVAEAPIRGRTSQEEAQQLRDEGIEVVSLPVPSVSKRRLQ